MVTKHTCTHKAIYKLALSFLWPCLLICLCSLYSRPPLCIGFLLFLVSNSPTLTSISWNHFPNKLIALPSSENLTRIFGTKSISKKKILGIPSNFGSPTTEWQWWPYCWCKIKVDNTWHVITLKSLRLLSIVNSVGREVEVNTVVYAVALALWGIGHKWKLKEGGLVDYT